MSVSKPPPMYIELPPFSSAGSGYLHASFPRPSQLKPGAACLAFWVLLARVPPVRDDRMRDRESALVSGNHGLAGSVSFDGSVEPRTEV